MKNYLLFGKRATDALWEDEKDFGSVVEAIDDLEAELFIFDPKTSSLGDLLLAYSKWSDYSFLTPEQYRKIRAQV